MCGSKSRLASCFLQRQKTLVASRRWRWPLSSVLALSVSCTAGLLNDSNLLRDGLLMMELSTHDPLSDLQLPSVEENGSRVFLVKSDSVVLKIRGINVQQYRFGTSCGSAGDRPGISVPHTLKTF